jgi:hypothetical protein
MASRISGRELQYTTDILSALDTLVADDVDCVDTAVEAGRVIVWDIIADLIDTIEGTPLTDTLTSEARDYVVGSLTDYVGNYYGDE